MHKTYQRVMGVLVLALALVSARQREALTVIARQTVEVELLRAAAQTQTVAAAESVEIADEPLTPESPPKTSIVDDLLRDPERLEQVKAIVSPELDAQYAPLFRALEMTPEEISAIKDLLLAKKIIAVESGLRNPTDAARNPQPGLDAIDRKIVAELGADGFEVYQGYEKSMPERTMLADYKRFLENRGEALTYDQEDRLIRLMYDERAKSHAVDALFSRSDFTSIYQLRKTGNLLQEYDAWQGRVRAGAAPLLSADQQALLDEQLIYQRDALTNFIGEVTN